MESDIVRSARRLSPCLNHVPGVNNASVRLLDSTPDSITRVCWNGRFRGTRSAIRLRWRLNVVANVGTYATPVSLLRLVATSALAITIMMKHHEDNYETFSKCFFGGRQACTTTASLPSVRLSERINAHRRAASGAEKLLCSQAPPRRRSDAYHSTDPYHYR
jgi:hypothetical protein